MYVIISDAVPLEAVSLDLTRVLLPPNYKGAKSFKVDVNCYEYDVARFWCEGRVCEYYDFAHVSITCSIMHMLSISGESWAKMHKSMKADVDGNYVPTELEYDEGIPSLSTKRRRDDGVKTTKETNGTLNKMNRKVV